VKILQMLKGGNQGLLHGIIGMVVLFQDLECHVVKHILVLPYNGVESIQVPQLCRMNE